MLFFCLTFFNIILLNRYSVREQLLDEGTVSELGIRQAHRHDTGVFTCHASNAYGQDEMSVQLIIQGYKLSFVVQSIFCFPCLQEQSA